MQPRLELFPYFSLIGVIKELQEFDLRKLSKRGSVSGLSLDFFTLRKAVGR